MALSSIVRRREMKPTLAELEAALDVAVQVFQRNPNARELPGFHSYPENSCERAAALLTMVLARKFPGAEVLFVKGLNPRNSEMHFWVEAGEFAVDPTAHQFESFHGPFVCKLPSPLEATFQREEAIRDPQQSTDLPGNSNGKWNSSLAALCSALDANPSITSTPV